MERENILLQVALDAFHETKHGGTSHNQLSHGRWASGTAVTIGDTPEPTWDLFTQVHKQGGFTYEPLTNHSPTSGFVVSAYKSKERVFDATKFREKHLVNYINKHFEVLSKPNTHMGAWHDEDNGKVYLDVTVIHGTLGPAMAQAKKIGELAIFDLSSFETIMAKAKADKKKKKIRGTLVKITKENKDEVAKEIMKKLFPKGH